ncbi:MAG: hypothetical protein QOE33_2151 [Acidobacteriota bacterium]|nr:hypothetical protein [Acidobacteriota bacterium]
MRLRSMSMMLLATLALFAATLAFGNSTRAARSDDNKLPGVSAREFVVAGADDQTGDELHEEFHQTYALARDGRVSLKNINGPARISVWDRDEVKVDAVKHARSRERLEEATIEVETTGDSVSVHTHYPTQELRWERDSRDNPASVEYTLTIPRTSRVDSVELINGGLEVEGLAGPIKATCINGRLRARNLAGEARLSTINGPLEAEFESFAEGKAITLNSVNGSVDLFVPTGANASVKADTVHGTITNDFNMAVKRGEWIGESLEGQLGGGGTSRVKLSNVNGSIRIRRAGR